MSSETLRCLLFFFWPGEVTGGVRKTRKESLDFKAYFPFFPAIQWHRTSDMWLGPPLRCWAHSGAAGLMMLLTLGQALRQVPVWCGVTNLHTCLYVFHSLVAHGAAKLCTGQWLCSFLPLLLNLLLICSLLSDYLPWGSTLQLLGTSYSLAPTAQLMLNALHA